MNELSPGRVSPYILSKENRLSFEHIRSIARRLSKIILLLLLLQLTACFDLEDSSTPANDSSSDISISSNTVYMSQIDSQHSVTAVFVDSDGVAFLDQPTMQWSSDASSVATVDNQGVITATGFGEAQITVTANGVSKSISVVVSDAVITISGQVRYEDREYGAAGFVTNTDYFKNARYVKIDLLSSDDRVLQTTYSDANGSFSITGAFDSQHKISAYTITDPAQGLNLQVKDRSGNLYAATALVSLDSSNTMSIDIPLSSEASGAFNILDVFTNAAQFTLNYTSLTEVTLAAFWEKNNYDGTYYCNGFDSYWCVQGQGIYVYNAVGGDTDEFDDDVLYHEFGHYFLDTLSRDDSTGGCHTLSSKDLDLRLSWSEGFGDFFPAAVKSWLSSSEATAGLLSTTSTLADTAYIDTYASTVGISIDILSLSPSIYYSAANEMAVARVLYTMYQRFGMEAMVTVLSNDMKNVMTPTNMEAFWDGWINSHQPNDNTLSTLQTIFNERKIYYQDDNYEGDDSIESLLRNPISLNNAETHYLYKPVNDGGDVDIVPFSVTAGSNYRVETLNLVGGTDTHITILDSLGDPLVIESVEISNDDQEGNSYFSYDYDCGSSRVKNNTTALSSKVEFVSPITGTYYAKIRTTTDPEPYLSAGRYGSYDVRVQEY